MNTLPVSHIITTNMPDFWTNATGSLQSVHAQWSYSCIPHTPSWHDAGLIKHRNNFTFPLLFLSESSVRIITTDLMTRELGLIPGRSRNFHFSQHINCLSGVMSLTPNGYLVKQLTTHFHLVPVLTLCGAILHYPIHFHSSVLNQAQRELHL